ncbi:MAG: response regulator [Clostridium sp.]
MNIRCDEAADGLAALEKLQMIISIRDPDVMMPGLDGFETLERIRKISEIPVIMLTASREYDKLTGFGLGVDYVSKPSAQRAHGTGGRSLESATERKVCSFLSI